MTTEILTHLSRLYASVQERGEVISARTEMAERQAARRYLEACAAVIRREQTKTNGEPHAV